MIQYTIKYYLNTISPKGRIAWEYNPLRNFRRTKNTDENGLHYNQIKLYGHLYTLISIKQVKDTQNNTILYILERYKDLDGKTLVIKKNNSAEIVSVFLDGEEISKDKLILYSPDNNIEAGSIVDLDTELLNFSLNNPVQIEAQPSYDGSVNLILNDDRNPPRLINTRFSTRQLNTYEIVDRIGDNDTNIYDDDVNQFDLDTSLYKKYNKIPKIQFNKVLNGGNLKVGNYVLYFRYCDADENETDFVAESGIIAIFKGNDKDPFSIDGGFTDMNAHKTIDVTLTNIDEAYDYIKVYYSRTSSDLDQNRQVTAHKLVKKFVVSRNQCHIVITGDEEEELIPTSELVSEYFIAEKVKTQAQCQNMLFLGNVTRPDPLHQDLTDLSIRMLPYFIKHSSKSIIGYVDPNTYIDNENVYNNYEYYNTKNIYYNVGYWNEEMYRIGVVYIMYDNTLSKVYNIRGCESLPSEDDIKNIENNNEALSDYYTPVCDIFDDEGNRQYIEISEEDYSIVGGKYLENARGVVRFADFHDSSQGENSSEQNSQETNNVIADDFIYQLGVIIPEDVISYLKNYCGIKGLFFVRQKRMPTILAQGLTLPIDPEARVPLIYTNSGLDDGEIKEQFFIESFISQEKIKTRHRTLFRHSKYIEKEVIHDYDKRLIYPDNTEESRIKNSRCAAILCPEYEIRQQYYNQLFTGTDYPISYSNVQYGDITNGNMDRFYTHDGFTITYSDKNYASLTHAKLVSVSEEVPTVAIGEEVFRGVCGTAQEPFRYKFAFKEGSKTKSDTNLVRGIWHPYIGAVFQNKVSYGKLVNIYIPGYNISELANYYMTRYSDNSPYYPIGDRLGIDDLSTYEFSSETGYKLKFFRGDCYLCTFTHRLNRNFQDPAAPANDTIIDKDSWVNFDPEDESTFDKVNLGDINAVKMGSWYTFRVRSNTNLSIRSLDESHLEEKGIFGLARGFYPLQQELLSGNNKIPDSYNVNDGFRSNFGERFYLRYPNVPYVKNNYENRILYSQIAVNDAFRNGYRVFKSTHFNDYTKEYGSIVKLVTMSSQGLQNGLLCVFEHGIGYVPVNERAVAGEGAGGNVFINTSNVLPDNPRILSDQFGSQWQESIIQTPYYVYGVDTVAKKIWRTNGAQLEVISDFKMNKFLVDNITLSEKELTPIIGVRNVKSHYNANKSDVMFTFYDNQYGLEEKVWNLCWNEISQCFTTFYSWVPSYSENIDNIYFSFDREMSKAIAKLGTSQVGSTNADGIVLDPAVVEYTENFNEQKHTVNNDGYADVLIPNYSMRNEVISTNDSDITIGPYPDPSNNITYKGANYYKIKGIEFVKNERLISESSLKTLIKKYIKSCLPCESWTLVNSSYLSDILTTSIGVELLGLENRILPEVKLDSNGNPIITFDITYEIEKDPYGNWRYFTIYDELELVQEDQNTTREIVHHMLKFCPNPTPFDDYDDLRVLTILEGSSVRLYSGQTVTFSKTSNYRPKKDSSPGEMEVKLDEYFNAYEIYLQNITPAVQKIYNMRSTIQGKFPSLSKTNVDNLNNIITDSSFKSNLTALSSAITTYQSNRSQAISFNKSYSEITTINYRSDVTTKYNACNFSRQLNNYDVNSEQYRLINAIINSNLGSNTSTVVTGIGNPDYDYCSQNYSNVANLYSNGVFKLGSGNTAAISTAMSTYKSTVQKYISDKQNFINYNKNKIKLFNSRKVWYVYIKANINVVNHSVSDYTAQYQNAWIDDNMKYDFGYYSSVVAITSHEVFNNYVKYELDADGHYVQLKTPELVVQGSSHYYKNGNDYEVLTSDFWKHGQAGIIDIKDEIQPCMWYGKQHPFEFEFVVRDTPNMHKVFDNLEIISNKAEPESFHFDVVGEVYDFHNDKRNMYWRQEATKEFWQNYGINITFDRNYTKLTPERNIKSTIFPLYYNRIDTYDNIYDSYTKITGTNRDYRNLSGSEIIFDKQLNEYRVRTHIKNSPITQNWNEVSQSEWGRYPIQYSRVRYNNEAMTTQNWLNTSVKIGNTTKTVSEWFTYYKEHQEIPDSKLYPSKYYVYKDTGRIRGNSHYKEDRWKIQIPSITFMQKNEHDYISGNVTRPTWTQDGKPPIVINYIPEDYPCTYISHDYLPNIYDMGQTKLQVSTVNGRIEDNWPDKNECAWEVDGRNVDNSMIDITPWTYRKETKIRDKYMRVRIRYEGHQLAVIQAVLTTYTESYA